VQVRQDSKLDSRTESPHGQKKKRIAASLFEHCKARPVGSVTLGGSKSVSWLAEQCPARSGQPCARSKANAVRWLSGQHFALLVLLPNFGTVGLMARAPMLLLRQSGGPGRRRPDAFCARLATDALLCSTLCLAKQIDSTDGSSLVSHDAAFAGFGNRT